jgi:hypothetical protein
LIRGDTDAVRLLLEPSARLGAEGRRGRLLANCRFLLAQSGALLIFQALSLEGITDASLRLLAELGALGVGQARDPRVLRLGFELSCLFDQVLSERARHGGKLSLGTLAFCVRHEASPLLIVESALFGLFDGETLGLRRALLLGLGAGRGLGCLATLLLLHLLALGLSASVALLPFGASALFGFLGAAALLLLLTSTLLLLAITPLLLLASASLGLLAGSIGGLLALLVALLCLFLFLDLARPIASLLPASLFPWRGVCRLDIE